MKPDSRDCSVPDETLFSQNKLLTETFAEHCSSSRIPNISLSCVLKEISSEALLLQLLLVSLPKAEVSVHIFGSFSMFKLYKAHMFLDIS